VSHLTVFFTLLSFVRYHLKDVIVGKIYFLLVRIKIRHMELAIIKREIAGTGNCLFIFVDKEILNSFERPGKP